MRRAWVGSPASEPAAPRPQPTPAQRQCAILLAAKRDYAWRSATSALSWGNWAVAAAWEEQRVTSEDELARLYLEGCFDRPPDDGR